MTQPTSSSAPADTQPKEVDARRARLDQVREKFVRERGFFAPPFEAILEADPDYLDAYIDFSSGPWRRGTLSPKVKELIYVAVDASVTHQHGEGMRAHLRSALRHGATREEVVSVLELTSLLGLQALQLGLPALLEDEDLAPGVERDWLVAFDQVDRVGAAETRSWLDGVRRRSPLDPSVVELILVAVNAATTHLHEAATRRHVRAALAAGATRAEIVEVLQLVSVLGIHTATMAMPILVEEDEAVLPTS